MTGPYHPSDTADLAAFARLVGQMRSAQRAYFKGRSAEDLDEAKRLERRVDAALESVLSPGLFDAPGGA